MFRSFKDMPRPLTGSLSVLINATFTLKVSTHFSQAEIKHILKYKHYISSYRAKLELP